MPPEAEVQGRGGGIYDAPNQMVVRPDKSGPGTPPDGDGGSGGTTPTASPQPSESKLPGTHAGLDDLAAERGVEWSRDDLNVAEKQAELGG
jgi:hypothetical protein